MTNRSTIAQGARGHKREVHVAVGSDRIKVRGLRNEEWKKGVQRDVEKQLRAQGRLQPGGVGMTGAMEVDEIAKQVYDDMSGRALDNKKVEAARDEAMEEVRKHKVYTKVPVQLCREETGGEPIGTRWEDTNKGDVTPSISSI